MSVNSNINKELLFDLLSSVVDDNGFLIDIFTLQSFLDKECDIFEKNKSQYNSLSEINKIILNNTYKFLLENQLKNTTSISVINEVDLFDNKLNDNFKIAKENFENTITLKKPDEIKFKDEIDYDLPPENLENIMNQTLADRANELNNITLKYSDENKKKAENWINKDNTSDDTINTSDSSDNGDNTLHRPKKSVSFEEPVETFNLFNKLKKKQDINPQLLTQINKKLDKLLSQQKLILELLSIPKSASDDSSASDD
jgi:hypothetical protein|tara:strand:+ start:226 stop:996 length:771 start_codon:yes stop_codon:yes gene_type:complete